MHKRGLNQKMALLLCVLLLAFATTVSAEVSNYIKTSIPDEVSDENFPDLQLQYKLYIENFQNGVISKVDPDGTHTVLGVY